jgi:hypothetical protein
MEKKTIATLFNEIIEGYDLTPEHKKFLAERLAQTEKKNTNRKPTSKQLANKAIADAVYEWLIEKGEPCEVRTIMKEVPALSSIPDLSNQYTTSILTSLRKVGKVARTEIKGKAYYEGLKD